MKDFIVDVFSPKFSKRLNKRLNSFSTVFNLLEKRNHIFKKFLIVETGTARQTDNFEGDGQSTLMFDAFVNYYDGAVMSVDISEENCDIARSQVSSKTSVICEDSVKFLKNFNRIDKIDLLYLDSFDLDFNNPHPSAMHHLKELTAVYAKLPKNSIVLVDDNQFGSGKGIYVDGFFKDIGATKIIDDYQIAYIV